MLKYLSVVFILHLPMLLLAQTPETRPAFNTGKGFFVKGGRLYDKNGFEFTPYGVNNVHIWLDEENSLNALRNEIPRSSSNIVRLVTTGPSWTWNQQSITSSQKRLLVQSAITAKLIPMLELHDGTCVHEVDLPAANGKMGLKQIVDHWLFADNIKICQDFEDYALINIANEWGPDITSPLIEGYLTGYKDAITRMRAAGITNTLVIDAGGCGQDPYTLLQYADLLLEHDPQHNIVASIHLYGLWKTADKTFTDWTPPFSVETIIPQLAALQTPVMVGEFSWTDPGTSVNYDPKILLRVCREQKIGWLFWAWHSNDNEISYNISSRHDLKYTSPDDLTAAGKFLIGDPVYGFKALSQPSSLFPVVTGIESVELQKEIAVFPNPGNSSVFVKGLSGQIHYSVYDGSGSLVKQGLLTADKNEISIQDFTTGIYTLHLFKGERFAVYKFQKK